jgi:hypothetical protein
MTKLGLGSNWAPLVFTGLSVELFEPGIANLLHHVDEFIAGQIWLEDRMGLPVGG